MNAGRKIDCVVVGAGLAGATLAVGLAECGLSVVTVDARSRTPEAPGRDVRGLALAPATQHLLARLGLWEALRPEVHPLREIVVTDRGHFGSLVLSSGEAGVPALGYVCPADRLLGRLDAALMNLPTVTTYWHATILEVAARTDGVDLRITRADREEEELLSARLLVAADGVHSSVRTQLGIGVTSRDYGQSAIVCSADVERPRPATAFERLTRDGPLAILPCGDRRVVIVRVARNAEVAELMRLEDDAFLTAVRERFGAALGRFSAAGERRAYPLALSRARSLTAPRTVLVGNAANTIHPNGAQGLNLGLRDVATLLDLVADARARDGDIGAPPLLENYVRRRRPDQDRIVRFSDGLARVSSIDLAPIGALRGAALFTLDLFPAVKRALMSRLMGLRGEANPWLRPPTL